MKEVCKQELMYLTLFGLMSEPTLEDFYVQKKKDTEFGEVNEHIIWPQTALRTPSDAVCQSELKKSNRDRDVVRKCEKHIQSNGKDGFL